MAIEYFMVFGYLFISMAVGVFCVGAVLDLWKTAKEGTTDHRWSNVSRLAATLALPLVVIGILCTLIHLGKVERFFNIILNPNSWLALEAWCAGFFTLVSFLYFLQWRKGSDKAGPKKALGIAGIILGFGAILCMSMIYSSVKAIPAWNTTLLLYINMTSAFALGVFLIGTIISYQYSKASEDRKIVLSEQLGFFTSVGFLSVILMALTYGTYQAQLIMLPEIDQMFATSGWLIIVRVLVGILLPFATVGYALFFGRKKPNLMPVVISLGFVVIVIGDVLSRMVHFLIAVKPPLF